MDHRNILHYTESPHNGPGSPVTTVYYKEHQQEVENKVLIIHSFAGPDDSFSSYTVFSAPVSSHRREVNNHKLISTREEVRNYALPLLINSVSLKI